MEENGAISYISVIFQANSFSDLLSRINDVGEIMQYQQNTLYAAQGGQAGHDLKRRTRWRLPKQGRRPPGPSLSAKQVELQGQIEASVQLIQKLQADVNTRHGPL